jgi:hypothetical protein
MGMFRSVEMDLTCGRCGRSHRADVQFKTDDDWCEVYAIGDRVEELPNGEEWDGIAARFCPSCQKDHRAERERAMATVLMMWVRAGQLVLKLAEAEVPLTADEILARGGEKADAARRDATMYGLTLVLTGLCFLDREGAWLPTTKLHASLWPSLYRALNQQMQRLGWPAGDDLFREDLVVHLDEERRIRVHLR